jgi:hypothetical protein
MESTRFSPIQKQHPKTQLESSTKLGVKNDSIISTKST